MKWLVDLLELFAEAFLSWIREQGRQEVIKEIREETDRVREKHAEIDRRPDSSSPFDRLRSR